MKITIARYNKVNNYKAEAGHPVNSQNRNFCKIWSGNDNFE